jgi:hypothetical protein
VPHVALSYVIGTIAILAVLLIVFLIRFNTITQVQNQAEVVSLRDVSEYAASQLININSMAQAQGPIVQNVTFHISLPPTVNSRGYQLMTLPFSNTFGWRVVSFDDDLHAINATAIVNVGIGIRVFNSVFSSTHPTFCVAGVTPLPSIFSGDSKAVVWEVVSPNATIYLGLGDSKPGMTCP